MNFLILYLKKRCKNTRKVGFFFFWSPKLCIYICPENLSKTVLWAFFFFSSHPTFLTKATFNEMIEKRFHYYIGNREPKELNQLLFPCLFY